MRCSDYSTLRGKCQAFLIVFFRALCKDSAMTLHDIIRKRGVAECAQRWGVSVRAVTSWLYCERTPRPRKALEICALEGKSISMSSIYGSTCMDNSHEQR